MTEERAPYLGLLSKEAILEKARPAEPVVCGVYFLIDEDEIVYVGQSTDIFSRIATHARSDKQFEKYAYLECPAELLSEIEAAYIVAFAPQYNGNLPCNRTWISFNQLCVRAKRAGIGTWDIRHYICDNAIDDVNGYYRIADFEDLDIAGE